MDKETYIKYREQEEIPVLLYYEYYLEHKDVNKPLISIIDFEQAFLNFLTKTLQFNIMQTTKGQRHISFEGIYQKICRHYNKKFDLFP